MDSQTRKHRKYVVPTCIVAGAMVAGSLLTGCGIFKKPQVCMYGAPMPDLPEDTLIDTIPADKQQPQTGSPQQTDPNRTEPGSQIPPDREKVYGPPV